jgi:hypothetical protein
METLVDGHKNLDEARGAARRNADTAPPQSTDPLLLLARPPRQFGANIARDGMSGVENHDRPRIV